jgi:hypothetical protein
VTYPGHPLYDCKRLEIILKKSENWTVPDGKRQAVLTPVETAEPQKQDHALALLQSSSTSCGGGARGQVTSNR